MSNILGIDPGSKITGYGLIKKETNSISYLDSGCINTKSQYFPKRLKIIYNNIVSIIESFKPKCIVIEKVFLAKNVNSAFKLSQVNAIVMLAAVNYNIIVFEYTPNQIKRAVIGYGFAEKYQIQCMVQELFKLSFKISEDAADALAVAISHYYISKNNLNHLKSN